MGSKKPSKLDILKIKNLKNTNRDCKKVNKQDIRLKVDRYHFFSNTFDTKYRAENFTDTDSDTDTDACRHMVDIISHLLLYKYIDKAFK